MRRKLSYEDGSNELDSYRHYNRSVSTQLPLLSLMVRFLTERLSLLPPNSLLHLSIDNGVCVCDESEFCRIAQNVLVPRRYRLVIPVTKLQITYQDADKRVFIFN